jgi:hypothetical protein
MALTKIGILYWYDLIEIEWGFTYNVYTSGHLWHVWSSYSTLDDAKSDALELIRRFQESDNYSLRTDLSEEYHKFMKQDFVFTIMIPLKTEIEIEWYERKVINYGGYSFVWVNGDKDTFPFLIIPLFVEEWKINNPSYNLEVFNAPILNKVLSYLSQLSLETWLMADIHYEYFKNYFGRKESIFTQQSWISRANSSTKFPEHYFSFINEITDDSILVLVWFFRDWLNNTNIFSSFLSFYKIFENSFSDPKGWNDWIEKNYSFVYDFALTHGMRWLGDFNVFENLVKESWLSTKWEYLYRIERLGIAHARAWDTFRSPARFIDIYKTYYSQQVIKFMAWYYLLQKLWYL